MARSRLIFGDEFLQAVSDQQESVAELVDGRAAALVGCIEKLKPRDRELLECWYQKRGTTRSMAEQSGRPLDTIYKAMKRIRAVLFDCVTRTLAGKGTV